MSGQSMIAGAGSSYAMVILELKKWDERKGISNKDVIASLIKKQPGSEMPVLSVFVAYYKWIRYEQRFFI